jgi:hypothetical protein
MLSSHKLTISISSRLKITNSYLNENGLTEIKTMGKRQLLFSEQKGNLTMLIFYVMRFCFTQ